MSHEGDTGLNRVVAHDRAAVEPDSRIAYASKLLKELLSTFGRGHRLLIHRARMTRAKGNGVIRQKLKRPKGRKPFASSKHGAFFFAEDVLVALDKISKESCDLIISSPPYNIGKKYERNSKLSFEDYIVWQDRVIGALVERLRDTGSICWQTGSYVKEGEAIPLDVYLYHSFKKRGLKLRNRIIWKFNFGLNSKRRLSGRYETILWFTKGDHYKFNLDPIRVSQLYPGKRHPMSNRNGAGQPSGNPLGKNPGDYWEFSAAQQFRDNTIWDFPNVKANHPEKTFHECQFPVELAERCVLAFTEKGDVVLDPFVGAGTSVIAAIKHQRLGIGIDRNIEFLKLARKRVESLLKGELKLRPMGRPIHRPKSTDKVAMRPNEWATI
jgi:adenine-specific DNA-methyltransferase